MKTFIISPRFPVSFSIKAKNKAEALVLAAKACELNGSPLQAEDLRAFELPAEE